MDQAAGGREPRGAHGDRLLLRSMLLLVAGWILLAGATPARAQPDMAVAVTNVAVVLRCQGTQIPALAEIQWQTRAEQNVVSLRVHREAATDPPENRWVNRFPLAAMGPGTTYSLIDGTAMPGVRYRYRLYAFDESGRLSLAKSVPLLEELQPTCAYLPAVGSQAPAARE